MAGLFLLEAKAGWLDLHLGLNLSVQKCESQWHGLESSESWDWRREATMQNSTMQIKLGVFVLQPSLQLCHSPALRLFGGKGGEQIWDLLKLDRQSRTTLDLMLLTFEVPPHLNYCGVPGTEARASCMLGKHA